MLLLLLKKRLGVGASWREEEVKYGREWTKMHLRSRERRERNKKGER